MAKRKKYQFAGKTDLTNQPPNKDILRFLLSQQGENVVNQYENAGYKIKANDNDVIGSRDVPNPYEKSSDELSLAGDGGIGDAFTFAKNIGNVISGNDFKGGLKKGIRDFFGVFNPAARIVTNAANKITDIKSGQNEYRQYLQSLQPVMSENYNEQGLNNLPIYTKYGGGECEYGCGEVDHAMINEMMKSGGWIKGAIKHPGRCSNPGDSRCPKGSPQYNLAMRFKHGDLHHSQYGSGTLNFGAQVGTPIDTQYSNATYKSTQEAKNFTKRKGFPNWENVYTSGVPQYVDSSGKPYVASPTKQLPTKLPNYIQSSDVHNEQGVSWYVDPYTGYTVDIDPSVATKFKNTQVAQPIDMVAKYPYGGGPLTAEGAKEILRDGTVHGKKLTPAQRRYFGYIAGGGKPKSQYGDMNSQPIEAEQGEVFQTPQGQVNKVPDSAPTHEDGGVVLNNAERVLENTSDLRKDKKSKHLLLSPQLASLLTGTEIKSSVSHSGAMDKAQEGIHNKQKSLNTKINKNVKALESNAQDFYANNSLDFNLMNLNGLPDINQIFDTLFQHQEMVKNAHGIRNPEVKAQVGINNASRLHPGQPSEEGWSFLYSRNGKNYFQKQDGTVVSTAGPKMSNEEWTKFINSPQGKATRSLRQQGNIRYGYTDAPMEGLVNQPQLNPYTGAPSVQTMDIVPDQTTITNTTPGNRLKLNLNQPKSQFNEPLHWYDVAGPLSGLTEGRIPVRYNGADLNQIRLKLQNPLPSLQQGQRDFNDVLAQLPQNSQGYSNASDLFSRKYNVDNQVLGQYENINANIKNQETMYNAGVKDRQSLINQQARGIFEDQRLGSIEAQRLQRRTDWDSLMQTLAQNRALNRNGNLVMQLFPAFDQNAQYNGYQVPFRRPLNFPNQVGDEGLPANTSIITNTSQSGKPQYFIKNPDGTLKEIKFKGN